MNVLVTGANGFVGRYVVSELLSAGHSVIKAVHHASGPDTYALDLQSASAINELIRSLKPDACIHLAGMAFVPQAWKEPDLAFRVNVEGTVHLLEAFRRHAPSAKIVYVSTSQIYGNRAHAKPFTEDAPLQPDNLYAVTKMTADLTSLLYAKRYSMPILCARPCNHIGPHQSTDYVVSAFAQQVSDIAAGRQEPLMKVGNVESEREFLDVRDVARAYRLLLEQGHAGEAYNIATGRFVKISYILNKLCELAGVKPRIEIDQKLYRPTDSQPSLDTSKILKDVQWQPTFTLEKTLEDILGSLVTTPK